MRRPRSLDRQRRHRSRSRTSRGVAEPHEVRCRTSQPFSSRGATLCSSARNAPIPGIRGRGRTVELPKGTPRSSGTGCLSERPVHIHVRRSFVFWAVERGRLVRRIAGLPPARQKTRTRPSAIRRPGRPRSHSVAHHPGRVTRLLLQPRSPAVPCRMGRIPCLPRGCLSRIRTRSRRESSRVSSRSIPPLA